MAFCFMYSAHMHCTSLLSLFYFLFDLVRLEPRASHLIGMHCTTGLHSRRNKICQFNQLKPLITFTMSYNHHHYLFAMCSYPQKKLCVHRPLTHRLPLSPSAAMFTLALYELAYPLHFIQTLTLSSFFGVVEL